jgi:hypothetical protein
MYWLCEETREAKGIASNDDKVLAFAANQTVREGQKLKKER